MDGYNNNLEIVQGDSSWPAIELDEEDINYWLDIIQIIERK